MRWSVAVVTSAATFERKVMDETTVEICEWYEGATLVRKTANGIDIPIDHPALPVHVIQRLVMTREQFENIYGKNYGN